MKGPKEVTTEHRHELRINGLKSSPAVASKLGRITVIFTNLPSLGTPIEAKVLQASEFTLSNPTNG